MLETPALQIRLELLLHVRRQFETNVFAAIETSKACLAELLKSRGRLVLIGSVAGYVSTPNASPYAMSKLAIRAFAEALRPELAPHA
jgi:short-subunit dehydrogenase